MVRLGKERVAGDAEGLGRNLGRGTPSGGVCHPDVEEILEKGLFKMPELVYNNKEPKEQQPKTTEGGLFG